MAFSTRCGRGRCALQRREPAGAQWQEILAGTPFQATHATLTHVLYVQSYAIGAPAMQRIADTHTTLMFFLQEGLVHRRQAHPPSRTAMEAIITCIFEIIHRQSRHGAKPEVASMMAHIAHLWLTPFLGSEEADEFIDGKLGERRSRTRPTPMRGRINEALGVIGGIAALGRPPSPPRRASIAVVG